MPINFIPWQISSSLTDHRRPRRRPRHVLRFISRLDPAPYRVSGLWISEESDQRLWRTPGEEMEESAISSRTSNHRPTRLMELFGNWNRSHPRSRRRRKPTGSRVAAGASVAVGKRIEVLARTAWDPPYKAVRLDLCLPIISVSIPPFVFSRMPPSMFILRQLKPPVLRLHFSSSDVRETTLFEEGEQTHRYRVSTSRPASHSGNKVTTVSDSRGMPIIVFRWNTYKRDEIEWVKPRQAGSLPIIKRPISAFFKVGR